MRGSLQTTIPVIKNHRSDLFDREYYIINMKWFGSINLQIVPILLNGIIPLGISAFVPPSQPDARILLGISRNNAKFHRSGDFKIPKATTESSETGFEAPSHRWNCPIHDDVCAETGVTLSRYMKEMVRANPELEEIESRTLHCYGRTDNSFVSLL
jgi:hypothetical protein